MLVFFPPWIGCIMASNYTIRAQKRTGKGFQGFFRMIGKFSAKIAKIRAPRELLKRRSETGYRNIWFYLMNNYLFAHQTNRPSYYYNKDLLVLLPRNSYMKTKFSAYWEISGTKYATFIPKFIILLPHKVYIISTQ